MTEERGGLPIIAFADLAALETWLADQPSGLKGIWVKLAKKDSGVASVSHKDMIDAGLCFGWIDGLINRYDASFYLIRFTPRRPKSKWSQVNVERAEALILEKRVRPAGMAEIGAARADGRWEAAYPPASKIAVPDDLRAALDAVPEAAAFFATLTGANRYAVLYRLHAVTDPKKRPAAIAKSVEKLARRETAY